MFFKCLRWICTKALHLSLLYVSLFLTYAITENILRSVKYYFFSERSFLFKCNFDKYSKYQCFINELEWSHVLIWLVMYAVFFSLLFLAVKYWYRIYKEQKFLRYSPLILNIIFFFMMMINFFGLSYKAQWSCPQFISGYGDTCCQHATWSTGSYKMPEDGRNLAEIVSCDTCHGLVTRLPRCEKLKE